MASRDQTGSGTTTISQSEDATTNAVTIELAHSTNDMGPEEALKTDYQRVDPEVAKYAGEAAVHIDDGTNLRLKKIIDRRVLVVMMVTYFLQAIDKSTVSFAAIMGVREDTNLQGP